MASSSEITLGFYTVEHDPTAGWIGGYLLLNSNGRPLEFHCSLPLRPTRTQEVLYGSSLQPYLVGDLIGRAVISRAKLAADILLTDLPEAMNLDASVSAPIVQICNNNECPDDLILVDELQLFTAEKHRQQVVKLLGSLPASFDLHEPVQRIREAFGEAKGSTRSAA